MAALRHNFSYTIGRTAVVTQDKRQRVLLGVLTSFLVGMGGVYWFVLRESDSGGSGMAAETGGKKVKREKRDTQKTKKTRVKRGNKNSGPKAEKVTREKKERTSKRKSRRGKGKSKVKKKKKTLPPAAYLPPKDDWLEDFDPNSFRPRLA